MINNREFVKSIHLLRSLYPDTQLQVTCDYWSAGSASSSSSLSSSSSSPSPLLQRLLAQGAISAACKPALDHLAVARLRQLRQEKGVRGIAQADAEVR